MPRTTQKRKTKTKRPAAEAANVKPPVKLQVRLAMSKPGVRVLVAVDPAAKGVAEAKAWPDSKDGKDRLVGLPRGKTTSADLPIEPTEDMWVEVRYIAGDQSSAIKIKYEPKKPFGYRVVKLSNPAKIDLIGSVPPIRIRR